MEGLSPSARTGPESVRSAFHTRTTPAAWEQGEAGPATGKADGKFRGRYGRLAVRHRMKPVSSSQKSLERYQAEECGGTGGIPSLFGARGAVSGSSNGVSHLNSELSPSKVRSKRRFRVPRGAGAASVGFIKAQSFWKASIIIFFIFLGGLGGQTKRESLFRELVQEARDAHEFLMMQR